MSQSKRLRYDPAIFPELIFESLVKMSQHWAWEYPKMHRIVLYGGPSDSYKYVLAIENPDIPGMGKKKQSGPTLADADRDLLRLVNHWQPDLFGDRIDTEKFAKAFKHKDDFNIDDWIVYLVRPGEKIYDVDEMQYWVLFDRKKCSNWHFKTLEARSAVKNEHRKSFELFIRERLTDENKSTRRKLNDMKKSEIIRAARQEYPELDSVPLSTFYRWLKEMKLTP